MKLQIKKPWTVCVFVLSLFVVLIVKYSNVTRYDESILYPNKTSTLFLTSRKTPNIFYFGITHHLNREKALACQKTWVRTLPNMHWYSDKPDVDLNATVISYNGGDTYDLIVFRMVMVFEHVGKNYPDYDWYVRLWDDSYIFKDRLVKLLDGMTTSSPVMIGRFGHHKLLDKPRLFVGGGAGWVFNNGAMRRLYNDNGLFTCNVEYMKSYLKDMQVPDGQYGAEDVYISQCFAEAGIKFVFSFGFHAQTLDHNEVKLTAREAVSGKLPAQERNFRNSKLYYYIIKLLNHYLTPCINVPNKIGVITLHYVKPSEMVSLYEQQKMISSAVFN